MTDMGRAVLLSLFLAVTSTAQAAIFSPRADATTGLASGAAKRLVQIELEKRYPEAAVVVEDFDWAGSLKEVQGATLLQEGGFGNALFRVRDTLRDVEGTVRFSAWVSVPIAMRRIHPMEILRDEDFKREKIDVSQGTYHTLRGLLPTGSFSFAGYEAKQTVLQGQPAVMTGIQRVADIKRGEIVQVQMISNGVSIQAPAVADEAGYYGQSIRVTIQKTKRQVQGSIGHSKNVEVRL